MHTFLTIILLQISLFGGKTAALKGAKVYLEETRTEKIVTFSEIGNSGEFLFNNMDPGNYHLLLEFSEDDVTLLDKRLKQNFETDIEVAYNIDKATYCLQVNDGFIKVELNDDKKVNERFEPLYEDATYSAPALKNDNTENTANLPSWMSDVPHTGEEKDFANEQQKSNKNSKGTSPIKIRFLKLTTIEEYGQIGLNIQSITQKEFYKLVVGKEDLPLETIGEVEVLKRME